MKKRARGTPGSFVAAATASGIIAQHVAGKAVRDALFLSSFHVRSLPVVMAGAALLSLVTIVAVSRAMSRSAPRLVLLRLFAVSALSFAAEWLTIRVVPSAVAVAVYLHVAVFSPLILSAFWSLINEHFDPHAARPAIARIATGATFGGVLGALGAWRASALVSLPTTVLLLGIINVLCMLGTLGIPPSATTRIPEPSVAPRPNALRLLLQTRYLVSLALVVGVGAAISSVLDYVFSAQVTAAYGTGPPLLSFFALFALGVSLLSLLLQISVGRIAIERLGIAINVAVVPGIVILGGGMGLAVPGLLSATLLRGAEMVQRNTLFRSAYELLYTPLEEHQKRVTKSLIDVGFDRVGTMVGSLLAVAAPLVFVHGQRALLGAAVLLALATLPLTRSLHLGYVVALKDRLREGEPVAPPPPILGKGKHPSLGPDDTARDALIEKIESVRPHVPDPEADAHRRELLDAVDALLSNDTERKRRALSDWNRSKLPLVPFGIRLLADEEAQAEARKALRAVANEATGQLLDALLDPSCEFAIRRRVPAVLAACVSQRAADGLLLGLNDERFEVRYACVRALMTVAERGRDVRFAREKIIETVKQEIKRITTTFHDLDDGSEEHPNTLLGLIARDRVTRSMESLFSLLSLILERDGLRLCFSGLHNDDGRQRGTALEYLQTVLPPELRDELLPLLTEAGPLPVLRPPAELLAELTSTMIAGAFQTREPLADQLRRCCETLVGMGAAFARIWTYDAGERVLVLRASVGMYTHLDGAHARVPLGALKIGQIAATRRPHVTNQVIGDPQIPAQDWAKREGLVAFAGHPLVANDELVGVVAVFAKHEMSSDMLAALAVMANEIARAIADERELLAGRVAPQSPVT